MGERAITHVLDTHAWVEAANQSPLPGKVMAAFANPDNEFGIASVSIWEVAKLVQLKRLVLRVQLLDWFASAMTPSLRIIELSPLIAWRSTQLAGFHKDPADQIIVATAITLGATLITKDGRIQRWLGEKAVWD
jgi:PIN domain nuclease of toxin-antitoxin system